MYEFHYKYIQLKYDNSANLLFADTDSLVYEIETGSVYENPLIFNLCRIEYFGFKQIVDVWVSLQIHTTEIW